MKWFAPPLLAAFVAVGCQGNTDLSPEEDKVMRGKLDQGLSPEEIEKHFGKDYMKNNSKTGAPATPPEKQPN